MSVRPGSPSELATIDIVVEIANTGEVAGPATFAVQLGLDGVPIRTIDVEHILPGALTRVEFAISPLEAGRRSIEVEIDPENEIEEWLDDNNSDSLTINVVRQRNLGIDTPTNISSGAAGELFLLRVDITEESDETLNVELTGGDGDADLFVQFGERPERHWEYQCLSAGGASNELCQSRVRVGTYHVAVYAYSPFGPTTLTATVNGREVEPFDIDLVFLDHGSPSQDGIIREAVETWERVIARGAGDVDFSASPEPANSCGTGSPAADDEVDDLRLYVGQQVQVTPCFEDPEMEELTLHARSSHPGVVSVETIGLQGVSPGTATLTVAVVDPGGMTAQTEFEVLIPNRPPVPGGPMPTMEVFPRSVARWVLPQYFTDPDRDRLVYGASAADSKIGSALVLDDTLTVISWQALGRIWGLNSFATVDENRGLLLFWQWDPGTSQVYPWPGHEPAGSEWEVAASLGTTSDSIWVSLEARMTDPRYATYQFQVGADGGHYGLGETNYRFFIYDVRADQWIIGPGWAGTSNAIAAGAGELTDVRISARGGYLTVTAASSEAVAELIRPDLDDCTHARIGNLGLGIHGRSPRVADTVLVNWIEATGLAVGGAVPEASTREDEK